MVFWDCLSIWALHFSLSSKITPRYLTVLVCCSVTLKRKRILKPFFWYNLMCKQILFIWIYARVRRAPDTTWEEKILNPVGASTDGRSDAYCIKASCHISIGEQRPYYSPDLAWASSRNIVRDGQFFVFGPCSNLGNLKKHQTAFKNF